MEEELYNPSSENKGSDQLRGYREADLRLCFRILQIVVFFHTAAHLLSDTVTVHVGYILDLKS